MASQDNGGASYTGGYDLSNIPNDHAPTQQAAEHPDQTTQGSVREGDRLSSIYPTQEEFFAPNAEDIIRDLANQNQASALDNSASMPWLVRVQTQTEYVYVAPDEAAGASVAEEEVGEEEVGDLEVGDLEDGENIEPQASVAGQTLQYPNVGQAPGSYAPQHQDHNRPTLPANVGIPFGPHQPAPSEPSGFGNVGNPYDDIRISRSSQAGGNQYFVGGPPFNLGPPQVFTGPTMVLNNVNVTVNLGPRVGPTSQVPPIPLQPGFDDNSSRGPNPTLQGPHPGPSSRRPEAGFELNSRLGQPDVPPYHAQNRADLSSIIPGADDGLSAHPRSQDPRSGQLLVGDSVYATQPPTSYDTPAVTGSHSGRRQSTMPHAPGSTNNSINNAGNVGQQARRRPPFVRNPNNPSAQMIPVDASGNPIRPSTARLPPRPGPLGLGTVGRRIRREDIQQEDPADDEDEELGGRQPQQRRPRHRAQAPVHAVGRDDDDDDDDDTDDEGLEPHQAKRQRRTSVVEGGGDKKKYEKRPGVARQEIATNNLQVLNPTTHQWRDAVYHDSIRGILLLNAGPVSQYRAQRARGSHPEDQTSFLPIARDWGLDRPDGWNRIIDQILYRFQREGYEPPAGLGNEPGYMMHNGRVVIDRLHHPIRNWPLIPATLSTKFEGGYMEAIRRLCAGIRVYDFWVRMPVADNVSVSIGVTGLANRTERFRNENGLAPWRLRSGANLLRDAIQARLSQADRDANSTRGILRLTKEELAEAKAPNKESPATKAKTRTHQERIARQKQAKGTQKAQLQEHDEQYEPEEDNAEDNLFGRDNNRPADDQGDEDEW